MTKISGKGLINVNQTALRGLTKCRGELAPIATASSQHKMLYICNNHGDPIVTWGFFRLPKVKASGEQFYLAAKTIKSPSEAMSKETARNTIMRKLCKRKSALATNPTLIKDMATAGYVLSESQLSEIFEQKSNVESCNIAINNALNVLRERVSPETMRRMAEDLRNGAHVQKTKPTQPENTKLNKALKEAKKDMLGYMRAHFVPKEFRPKGFAAFDAAEAARTKAVATKARLQKRVNQAHAEVARKATVSASSKKVSPKTTASRKKATTRAGSRKA